MSGPVAVTVPKWGLAMTEGTVTSWLAEEGGTVASGADLVEIETSKITNVVEAPGGGTLRRVLAKAGETLPVGALLGVLASAETSDAEIDRFVAGFVVVDPASDEGGQAPAPQLVEIEGRRLRYLVYGAERPGRLPVLMLHGFMADLDSWMLVRDRLAEDRQLWLIDLPGHGGSAKDVGPATLDWFVGMVRQFMDAVGLTRAHLVGHSLGGAVALGLAVGHPDRVASVTAIAAAGWGHPVDRGFITAMLGGTRARDFKAPAEQMFADPKYVTRDYLDGIAKSKRIDGVQAALEAIDGALLRDPATDGVGSQVPASVPVLAVIADQDRVIPPPSSLPSQVRTAHVAAGHIPQLEASGAVTAAIRDFLGHQD